MHENEVEIVNMMGKLASEATIIALAMNFCLNAMIGG